MQDADRPIRLLKQDALQQRRRVRIAGRFLIGAWGVELETFETDQARDRAQASCLP